MHSDTMSTDSLFKLFIATSIIASLVSATQEEQETSDHNQLYQEIQASFSIIENEMDKLKDILATFSENGDRRSLMEDAAVEFEIDVDGVGTKYDDEDGRKVRRMGRDPNDPVSFNGHWRSTRRARSWNRQHFRMDDYGNIKWRETNAAAVPQQKESKITKDANSECQMYIKLYKVDLQIPDEPTRNGVDVSFSKVSCEQFLPSTWILHCDPPKPDPMIALGYEQK